MTAISADSGDDFPHSIIYFFVDQVAATGAHDFTRATNKWGSKFIVMLVAKSLAEKLAVQIAALENAMVPINNSITGFCYEGYALQLLNTSGLSKLKIKAMTLFDATDPGQWTTDFLTAPLGRN